MRSEQEVSREMFRCKRERDRLEEQALETGRIPKDFMRYNVRFWTLRWVLGTVESGESEEG